ncbi:MULTISPECIES: Flp pilus assembly protein CpaB [unclassified Methylobacterium]|uniref:Flp pilus assembly protein CpaB n=1 Tax=unclassified Methylobacterium TaxID=2615210 RepID=UPI0006FDD8BD|nr:MULTISPECIES: Flp pilus assembly protein CpaB [unclassified Methylobacterium]KQO59871.1 Flp pilus assembly protein CpaB [Methylobacterium sp. Leaf86]KQO85824.1 Flp pilus assembly protein CpaB [Methylobacterium sp. Leaf91]
MKPARLAVLAIALAAGGGAAFLMSGSDAPPPAQPVVQAPPPPLPVTDVLVAAADLPMGQNIQAADLRWQPWPDQAITVGYMTRSVSPNAMETIIGSITRSAFLAGEPIRPQKIARSDGGFMAAILPSGMRAVAIVTDTRGSSSAGGFILPNDHVDVIRTYRDEDASRSGGGEAQISETLLTDIRVLAVGQIVQEKNGTNVVTGETATLALTPSQAETVTLAQKVGQLSLSLRSLVDAGRTVDAVPETQQDSAITVVRFGVARQQPRR